MIVTTAQLFRHAYGKYAVGAYNINNAEQAMGLFRGCIQSKAPFIIQISKGARKYTDKRMLEAIIRAAGEIFPDAIYAVHLDHGDEEPCYDCIQSGFYSAVMIDASHEPFDKNVAITKRVVDAAHAKGLSVEAELGMLGGVEEDIKAITSFLNPRIWWGFGTPDDYEVKVRAPEGYAIATSGRFDPGIGAYRAEGIRAFGLFIGKGYKSAEADVGDVHVRVVFT